MANTIVLRGGLDGTRNVEGKVYSAFSPGHIVMKRAGVTSEQLLKHTGGKGDFFVAKENWMQGQTINDAYAVNDWALTHRPSAGDVCQVRVAAGVSLSKEDKVRHAGDGTVIEAVINDILYQNTAASANVTNTTTETAFDKSYTIPGGTLKAGDVLKIRTKVKFPTTNSTDTALLKVKIGSTTIIATSAVDVADNDVGIVELNLVLRTVGASGTMIADGRWALGVQDTATYRVDAMESTSVDTTGDLAITVTVTWSVASASDIARLDDLSVELEQASEGEVIGQVLEDCDNSGGSSEAFRKVTFL